MKNVIYQLLQQRASYEVLAEMHLDIHGCENILVKLIDFNVILANIYRHPKNNLQNFINAANCNLERLNCSKVFLLGDNNTNFKFDSSTGSSFLLVTDYFNVLAKKGYFPLSNIPTRITENSATNIDHIMANDR